MVVENQPSKKAALASSWSPRSADRKKRRPKERHPIINRGTSKQASKKGSRRSKSVSPPDSARSPLDPKKPFEAGRGQEKRFSPESSFTGDACFRAFVTVRAIAAGRPGSQGPKIATTW
ncbi:hypothetical protein MTO96_003585 [Rhipicephalus appendiculatus]